MVNCKNCGAPLSLSDAYCPHCGTPNPEAQEHLKKLKELDAEMESAKQEVVSEVKKSKKGYGVLIILAMLLLSNLIVFVLHGASYEIAERIIASRMSEEEILTQMDELLDQGEYIEFNLFVDKYSLSYKDYREYMSIGYLADNYNRLVSAMTKYLYSTDNYRDPLFEVCEQTVRFKDEYKSVLKRDLDAKTMEHIEKINCEVDSYIKTFLKLNDEDIKGFENMSSSELLLLVNERLTNEK